MLRKLEVLDLTWLGAVTGSLEVFIKLRHLRELSLSGVPRLEGKIHHLKNCAALEILQLTGETAQRERGEGEDKGER